VEDDDEQMTERASVDLPLVCARWSGAALDTLEAQVATAGQRLLARLCELQWDAVDAEAVARYGAAQAPGSVERDGAETLRVASRFGTRKRQISDHTGAAGGVGLGETSGLVG